MSIDIDWEGLTTGPEGLALAESIRDFIHDKFQQIQLPRFIRSVEVHSFDFGKVCPVVEIKDICDPLPEFYEDEDDDNSDENGVGAQASQAHKPPSQPSQAEVPFPQDGQTHIYLTSVSTPPPDIKLSHTHNLPSNTPIPHPAPQPPTPSLPQGTTALT
ncbi:MAG: hypothetical protein Q9222_007477 [Ikaeria aurantiellina]